jgi:hypothetical protein
MTYSQKALDFLAEQKITPPELTGSPKQIAWAAGLVEEQIYKAIDHYSACVRHQSTQPNGAAVVSMLKNKFRVLFLQAESKFWIDNKGIRTDLMCNAALNHVRASGKYTTAETFNAAFGIKE